MAIEVDFVALYFTVKACFVVFICLVEFVEFVAFVEFVELLWFVIFSLNVELDFTSHLDRHLLSQQ